MPATLGDTSLATTSPSPHPLYPGASCLVFLAATLAGEGNDEMGYREWEGEGLPQARRVAKLVGERDVRGDRGTGWDKGCTWGILRLVQCCCPGRMY